MLIAARTLCDNFENHKTEITAVRAIWADPFIGDFRTRINAAINTYLGSDPKKDLRLATQALKDIQSDAQRDLSLFKIQLEVDYADDDARLSWLLATLGFSAHYSDVQKKDQEALIELLAKFKTNMTAALKTELTGKGIDGALIDDIKGYANPLRDADVTQEALKGTTKELTEEALTEFNSIYSQAMAISRISANLFKDKGVVRGKFVFGRLIFSLNKPKAIKKKNIQQGGNTPPPVV